MRALPGRESRTSLNDGSVAITRDAVPDEQRRRIIRATGELVAKRGYGDTSVELIVKRAHVAFKTFYNHFGNKEEAFVALFDTVTAESTERIDAAIAANAEAPWPQQVAAALREMFAVILGDPIISRAVIVEAPTVGAAITPRYQAAATALSPLLRAGREYDPRAAELPRSLEDTLAGGVLWSAYQRLIVGEVERIEELMPEAIVFVLRPYIGEGEAARWAEWSPGETTAPASARR